MRRLNRIALLAALVGAGWACGGDDGDGKTGGSGGGAGTGGSTAGTGGGAGGTGGGGTGGRGGTGGAMTGGTGGSMTGGTGGTPMTGGTGGARDGGAPDTAPARDGGGGGMGGTGGMTMTGMPYYPLKVGNSWTYRVTAPLEAPWMKVVTAERTELVGGTGPNKDKMAIRMVTKKGASDMTVNWQGPVMMGGTTIWVRYREVGYRAGTTMVNVEDWWEPYRLRLDESKTMMGQKWTETMKEYSKPAVGMTTVSTQNINWEVKAVNTTVTVMPPMGAAKMYSNCIQVSHSTAGGASVKNFWFCRGIGKVKETGGQTEELIDHKVVWP